MNGGRPGAGPIVLTVAVVAWVVGLALTIEHTTYDIWGAFWVAPLLMLLTIPIARRVAREHDDPGLARLLMLAAFIKVIGGSIARYWMAFDVYGGRADSRRYHEAGEVLAPVFRSGNYSELGEITGTRFIELLTGQVYMFTGATRVGGFMVFSWLAFLGLLWFYRAFRTALPEADHRRYALLVFFFPTLVFWPSSIGKEAWMVACLGLAAFGIARLFAGRRGGVLWAALGLWGAAVVRPHLAVILVVGLVVAAPGRVLLRAAKDAPGLPSRFRATGLALAIFLVFAAVLATSAAEDFFDLDRLDIETAEEVRTDVQRRTAQGGSEFAAPDAGTPLGFLQAAGTILFRPLPVEARNLQAMGSALEGLLLMILVYVSLPRLARLPATARRQPYLLFALAYVAAFVYAFAVIENFGILARQRAQLLPVLLVLLALRPARPRAPRRDTDTGVARLRT